RGCERESLGKVEAHLMTEDRQRAGARAIGLVNAGCDDAFNQIEILPHGLSVLGSIRQVESNAAAANCESRARSCGSCRGQRNPICLDKIENTGASRPVVRL